MDPNLVSLQEQQVFLTWAAPSLQPLFFMCVCVCVSVFVRALWDIHTV